MHIYVPSLGRANNLNTGKFLHPELTDVCRLVVHEDEAEEYKAQVPNSDLIMPCPVRGIANVRQWILENALGPYALMLDDDMAFDWRDKHGKLHRCSQRRFLKLYKLLQSWLAEGLVHVGISQRAGNNRIPEPWVEIARMNNAYAYNVEKVLEIGAKFNRLEVMEDFDMTLQLLRAGHKNRVTYKYCWSQPKSGAAGGCSTYRDGPMQHKAAHQLARLHPGLVRPCTKTAKVEWEGIGKTRTDVVISWKKAFKPSKVDMSTGIGAFLGKKK